ncbi:MAG: hypothetical protein KBC06_02075 [Candidatus Pacebacteria bacterium]|nr:hypothetical protein [Candidatus Paceibacterota bacterium]
MKQSKITNLLVIPLMASAILLSNPVLAADQTNTSNTEIRHKTSVPHMRRGIAGTVTSVNGKILTVTGRDGVQYTVDASTATIMKASDQPDQNPIVIDISNIKVGDIIGVRGTLNDTEIEATKIFDGKMPMKHMRHWRHGMHRN